MGTPIMDTVRLLVTDASRRVAARIANGVLPDSGLGGECCRHGLDGPVLVFGDGPAALPGEQVEQV